MFSRDMRDAFYETNPNSSMKTTAFETQNVHVESKGRLAITEGTASELKDTVVQTTQ